MTEDDAVPKVPVVPEITVEVAAPPVPKTPAQQEEVERETAGQRRVNLLWEVTQSAIALLSVGSGVYIMVYQTWSGAGGDVPQTLASMIFLVLGFYFARTNHEKIGGVGSKPRKPFLSPPRRGE